MILITSLRSDGKRIDVVSEIVGVSQVLKHAFEPIFGVILSSLDASAVFMRTKGLRALGQVIIEDPAILRTVSSAELRNNYLDLADLHPAQTVKRQESYRESPSR